MPNKIKVGNSVIIAFYIQANVGLGLYRKLNPAFFVRI